MPGKVIEKYWDRAKARAVEQDHAEDWPYVMAIYQNMTKNKKKPAAKTANISAIAVLTTMYQKDAGLRDRLGSLIKKTKSVYEKTAPLREDEEGAPPKVNAAINVLIDAFGKKDPFKKVAGFKEIMQELLGNVPKPVVYETVTEPKRTKVVDRKDDYVDRSKPDTSLDRPVDLSLDRPVDFVQ